MTRVNIYIRLRIQNWTMFPQTCEAIDQSLQSNQALVYSGTYKNENERIDGMCFTIKRLLHPWTWQPAGKAEPIFCLMLKF